MALTITATPKDASANSYVTLADANYYFSTKFKSADIWAELSDDQKSQLLIESTRMLEVFVYGGLKTTNTQALSWPRTNLVNQNGQTVDPNTIPIQLSSAQCEMADWILTEENRLLGDIELQQVDSFKAGPLDLKIKPNAIIAPPIVAQLISSISPDALISTTPGVKSVSMCR